MALEDIDLPRAGTHGYSPEDRLRAALAWSITGTAQGASDVCGIPRQTVDDWTRRDWWGPLVSEARLLKNDELDARLTNILDLATQALRDRLQAALDNPEAKVTIQQLAIVAAVSHDKRALLRGDPTSRTERVSAADRINKLRDEFAGMMQDRVDKVKDNKPDKAVKH